MERIPCGATFEVDLHSEILTAEYLFQFIHVMQLLIEYTIRSKNIKLALLSQKTFPHQSAKNKFENLICHSKGANALQTLKTVFANVYSNNDFRLKIKKCNTFNFTTFRML